MSGNGCSDDDGDGAFDGPVSMRGPINGIGLDPRFWSGGAVGLFMPVSPEKARVFDARPTQPEIYDYMSYCSAEGAGGVFPGRTWVASGYWATTARESSAAGGSTPASPAAAASSVPPQTRPCAARSAPGAAATGRSCTSPPLTPGPGGPDMITRAEPDKGAADPVAGGTVTIDVGRRRQPDTSTPVEPSKRRPFGHRQRPHPRGRDLHHRRLGGGRRAVTVGGTAFGSVTQTATANSPVAKLKRPKDGSRLNGAFTAKWTARHGNTLRSRLELGADGGKTWRPLAVGPARHGPGEPADLPRFDRGILQVVVSDGFNVDRSQVTGLENAGPGAEAADLDPDASPLTVLGDTNSPSERAPRN